MNNDNFLLFNKNDSDDLMEFLHDIHDRFPEHVTEVSRLYNVIKRIKANYITVIIEPEYIDKQYRDTYYIYFSQKFKEYERNCVRLSIFDSDEIVKSGGRLSIEQFADLTYDLDKILIGTIVLRPLCFGNLGTVLLDPSKLNVNGYVRTAVFKVMIYGRKLSIRSFPFMSQDGEAMTCAEVNLYNLLKYFGEKYSEYRHWTPGEILNRIEAETSERALPSKGMSRERISKTLSDAHMYPRIYGYSITDQFEQIVYSYVESGIPFFICLPHHVVTCVGHGMFEELSQELVNTKFQFQKTTKSFYLSTAKISSKLIVMDDNKSPYKCLTMDELVDEYAKKALHDENPDLDTVKKDWLYIIVPVYKRIFMDAAQANAIFQSYFLENEEFISKIRTAYHDTEWGRNRQNPFVWRMYLTASRSYRYFKTQNTDNSVMKTHYMQWNLPRFIWVCEISTVNLYKEGRARVEIVLDATASKHSVDRSVLSVGYREHYIYNEHGEIVEVAEDDNAPEPSSVNYKIEDNMNQSESAGDAGYNEESVDTEEILKVGEPPIDIKTRILEYNNQIKEEVFDEMFGLLYDSKNKYFEETYLMFKNSNLREV